MVRVAEEGEDGTKMGRGGREEFEEEREERKVATVADVIRLIWRRMSVAFKREDGYKEETTYRRHQRQHRSTSALPHSNEGLRQISALGALSRRKEYPREDYPPSMFAAIWPSISS